MGYAFFIAISVFALLMIPFSASAAQAASEGLRSFALDVLPALFPFMVCAGYITKSPVFSRIAALPRPLSGLVSALSCALLGTPSSAMIFGELARNGAITVKRASFLCGLLNLTGPVFIVSVLADRWFGLIEAALPFAIAHYLPPLIVALPLCAYSPLHSASAERATFSKAFISSVSSAVSNSLRVGGTIVFFFVIHAVLIGFAYLLGIPSSIPDHVYALLEFTGGLKLFSGGLDRFSAAVCSVILSFGGLCLFMQLKLVFPELRAKEYFLAKLISAASSGMVVWFIYPIFFKDRSVFSFAGDSLKKSYGDPASSALAVFGCAACLVLTLTVSLIASRFFNKKSGAAQPPQR